MSANEIRTAIFQCDGAEVPATWTAEHAGGVKQLDHLGTGAPLSLRIDRPPFRIRDSLPGRASDLLRIAAYVYGADQMVSRGGVTDVYSDRWQRRMALAIPVSDPDFWSHAAVAGRLRDLLNVLSDDVWEFSFSARPTQEIQPELFDPWQFDAPIDTVVLLSGGADSLCALIEAALQHGRRVYIASHHSNPVLQSRQTRLVDALRAMVTGVRWPHTGLLVNRSGRVAAETSQRTRAFLFASLGLAIANGLAAPEVLFCDNGVVSLNLPFTNGQVGAQATRSTHPRVLSSVNDLARLVFGEHAPRVRNSLWARTRPDALGILGASGTAPLLSETASCAHPRGRSAAVPHCGVCSQCIDRRLGTLAAGLDEYDPFVGYEVDIFRDNIPEGSARKLALGYYNLALRLDEATPDRILTRHQRVWECLRYLDCPPEQAADTFIRLLKRHGATAVAVMREQIARLGDLIVRRRLPPYSLPALLDGTPTSHAPPTFERAVFRRQGEMYVLTFEGKTIYLAELDGLAYIRELLRNPGREFLATDLLRRLGSHSASTGKTATLFEHAEAHDLRSTELPDRPLPDLDDAARDAYSEELQRLEREIDDAAVAHDLGRLERARRDQALLKRELSRAFGRGGRSRAVADPHKSPRQAVQKAIRRALLAIRDEHESLAHFLRNRVKTGNACTYEPDSSVTWDL